MRVIAGRAKGTKLAAPPGVHTRPTADRVKENLFNIIGSRVEGARVLDLYAGSGALGIEALSRGARWAVMVEPARRAIEALKRNVARTRLAEQTDIRTQNADAALAEEAEGGGLFDLIFLDPPYKIKAAELEAVLNGAADRLADGGMIVLEHKAGLVPLDIDDKLSPVDKRRYGDTGLSFFKKR